MPAMELTGLTKLYKNGKGIRDVGLNVEEGELFGFLGPNGAGKSTTIRTIMGYLTPSSGSGMVLGLDIVRDSLELRSKVGYLPSDISLYRDMSGKENIRFGLDMRGIRSDEKAQEIADRLGVDLKRPIRSLSRGQKQKVAIAAALAHDPQLIILDEPTTGLDPLMQEEFNQLLRELQAQGKTIFMSSHILSDVENLCSRVAVIREGSLVTVDSIESLRKRRRKKVRASFTSEPGSGLQSSFMRLPGVSDAKFTGNRLSFSIQGEILGLLGWFTGTDILDLTIEDPSLEEVFLEFYNPGNGAAAHTNRG